MQQKESGQKGISQQFSSLGNRMILQLTGSIKYMENETLAVTCQSSSTVLKLEGIYYFPNVSTSFATPILLTQHLFIVYIWNTGAPCSLDSAFSLFPFLSSSFNSPVSNNKVSIFPVPDTAPGMYSSLDAQRKLEGIDTHSCLTQHKSCSASFQLSSLPC